MHSPLLHGIHGSMLVGVQETLLHAFMHVCDGGSGKCASVAAEHPAAFRPRALSVAARFAFLGHAETWTVPRSGLFRITARGAKAADGAHRRALQRTVDMEPRWRRAVGSTCHGH